jgi:hypothetical protein
LKRSRFDFKYVSVPTNNISSRSVPAEGEFLLGEQILNIEMSDILSRNSKTTSLKNGRTEFITKANLNNEECTKAIPFLM